MSQQDATPSLFVREALARIKNVFVLANEGAPLEAITLALADVETVSAALSHLEAGSAAVQAVPLDMVLHCPNCGLQHVDAPDWYPLASRTEFATLQWTNPPHRSHLCHGCGHIWRPADVATNGVAAVKTAGKADSPIAAPLPLPVAQAPQTPLTMSDAELLDALHAALPAPSIRLPLDAMRVGYELCRSQWRAALATTPALPVSAAQEYPHEQMDAIALARYKVVPNTSGFWGWQVKAGDGDQTLYKGHKRDCELVARRLCGAFLDGGFVAVSAQALPAQAAQEPQKFACRDARQTMLALNAYFRRVGDLWEGPDGCGTPGTALCERLAQDAYALAHTPMALGLMLVPPLPNPVSAQALPAHAAGEPPTSPLAGASGQ